VITVIAGAAATLAGEYVVHSEALVRVGTGGVLIAGAVYFVFRWLGRRETRRRESAGGDQERPNQSEE
jgi:hypothetical protein